VGEADVVAGAGRGTGRAIARWLARDGVLVAVQYGAGGKMAQEVAEEIRKAGGQGASAPTRRDNDARDPDR
jgi:3-oxoacyl-[acyl-carrier protein] reductase